MAREIHTHGPLKGRMSVPGSKSLTNRALVCAALASGESSIRNASDSDDTALLANGLNQLGILVQRKEDLLVVQGGGGRLYGPKFPIPVGNAGTTFRFLVSLSALAEGRTVLEVSERMAERPIRELLEPLTTLGVRIRRAEPLARFEIDGGGLDGGVVQVDSTRSSQFLSSLLLVAPYARRDITLRASGRVTSAPYLRMTLEVMRCFGVEVEGDETGGFTVRGGTRYAGTEFTVEPDASSASYCFGAAAIAGGEVLVRGFSRTSLQGDAVVLDLLTRMGCAVVETSEGVAVRRDGKLSGLDVDMNAVPDLVPTIAAVALFADTPSRISNVAHLQYKESDRLSGLADELRKLGADFTVSHDGLLIRPHALEGAQLDPHDDHRLAMSFALIGLRVGGISIEEPECVRKSFPAFWEEFETLYET